MMAQMVIPQTTAPTIHAATHDPCQRVSATWPCLVIGSGQPCRVNALDVHPEIPTASMASGAARGASRRRRARLRGGGGTGGCPGTGPGSCAPRLDGALGVELTGCLPSGCLPAARTGGTGRPWLVLQAVVETVSRSPLAAARTPVSVAVPAARR